jgi:hypothetical protein
MAIQKCAKTPEKILGLNNLGIISISAIITARLQEDGLFHADR